MAASVAFAEHMRERRQASGRAQAEVAQAMVELGFSWQQTTVAKVETGARALSLDEAVALATVLSADFKGIFGKLGDGGREVQLLTERVRAYQRFQALKKEAVRLASEVQRLNAELKEAERAAIAAGRRYAEYTGKELPEAEGALGG